MIDEATAAGQLVPGQTVVELTSGNTSTGRHRLRRVPSVRGRHVAGTRRAGDHDAGPRGPRCWSTRHRAARATCRATIWPGWRRVAAALTVERRRSGPTSSSSAATPGHEDGPVRSCGANRRGHRRLLRVRRHGGAGRRGPGPQGAPARHCLLRGDPSRPDHRIQGGGYSMPELPLLDRN
jgi:hypothetical protein